MTSSATRPQVEPIKFEFQLNHDLVSFDLTPYPIHLRTTFGTSHSSSTIRENALLTITLSGHNSLCGYGEVGLPPKKTGCYEANFSALREQLTAFQLFTRQLQLQSSEEATSYDPFGDVPEGYFQPLKRELSDSSSTLLSTLRQLFYAVDTYLLKKHPSPTDAAFRCLFDVTLFDLWSRSRKQFVCELIGMKFDATASIESTSSISSTLIPTPTAASTSTYLRRPPCQPRSFYTVGMDSLETMLSNLDFGLRYTPLIKIKVDSHLDTTRQVLEAIVTRMKAVVKDGEFHISVDANAAWSTPETAMKFLDVLKPYREYISMIEQPFPLFRACPTYIDPTRPEARMEVIDGEYVDLSATTLNGWSCVAEAYAAAGLLIYGDESICSSADLHVLRPILHGINIKLEKAGGYRGAVKLLHAARASGVHIWLGCMVGSSLNSTQAVQLLPFAEKDCWGDLDGALLTKKESDRFRGGMEWTEMKDGEMYGTGRIQMKQLPTPVTDTVQSTPATTLNMMSTTSTASLITPLPPAHSVTLKVSVSDGCLRRFPVLATSTYQEVVNEVSEICKIKKGTFRIKYKIGSEERPLETDKDVQVAFAPTAAELARPIPPPFTLTPVRFTVEMIGGRVPSVTSKGSLPLPISTPVAIAPVASSNSSTNNGPTSEAPPTSIATSSSSSSSAAAATVPVPINPDVTHALSALVHAVDSNSQAPNDEVSLLLDQSKKAHRFVREILARPGVWAYEAIIAQLPPADPIRPYITRAMVNEIMDDVSKPTQKVVWSCHVCTLDHYSNEANKCQACDMPRARTQTVIVPPPFQNSSSIGASASAPPINGPSINPSAPPLEPDSAPIPVALPPIAVASSSAATSPIPATRPITTTITSPAPSLLPASEFTPTNIRKLRVAELRAELNSRSLPIHGLKPELTARLLEFHQQQTQEQAQPSSITVLEDFTMNQLVDVAPSPSITQPMVQPDSTPSRVNPTTPTNFSQMLVADLKQQCEERGLSINGKKADLIDRLQEAARNDEKKEQPTSSTKPMTPVDAPSSVIPTHDSNSTPSAASSSSPHPISTLTNDISDAEMAQLYDEMEKTRISATSPTSTSTVALPAVPSANTNTTTASSCLPTSISHVDLNTLTDEITRRLSLQLQTLSSTVATLPTNSNIVHPTITIPTDPSLLSPPTSNSSATGGSAASTSPALLTPVELVQAFSSLQSTVQQMAQVQQQLVQDLKSAKLKNKLTSGRSSFSGTHTIARKRSGSSSLRGSRNFGRGSRSSSTSSSQTLDGGHSNPDSAPHSQSASVPVSPSHAPQLPPSTTTDSLVAFLPLDDSAIAPMPVMSGSGMESDSGLESSSIANSPSISHLDGDIDAYVKLSGHLPQLPEFSAIHQSTTSSQNDLPTALPALQSIPSVGEAENFVDEPEAPSPAAAESISIVHLTSPASTPLAAQTDTTTANVSPPEPIASVVTSSSTVSAATEPSSTNVVEASASFSSSSASPVAPATNTNLSASIDFSDDFLTARPDPICESYITQLYALGFTNRVFVETLLHTNENNFEMTLENLKQFYGR